MLSIIILHYRCEQFTNTCLGAIFAYPPSLPYEIILVDNASQDGSIERLENDWKKKLPLQTVKLPENIGYGQGNAAGINLAQGEYIAIVNPDTKVGAGVFDGLLDYLKKNPKVGLVAPKLTSPDGKVQDSFRRFPTIFDLVIKRTPFLRRFFEKRLARFLLWNIDLTTPSTVDWVVGAFFVMSKDAWKNVDGFDPRYFLFLEDTDLCRKLWVKGYQVVFHPGYAVEHYEKRLSQTIGLLDLFRKKTLRIHLSSALKYFWKWRGQKPPRA